MSLDKKFYKSKKNRLPGTSCQELNREAKNFYKGIKSRTKRTPYVRSRYFRNEKVFLTLFWAHLAEKNEKDRARRLKFFICALDLIKNSTIDPETRENFQKKDELLHRFYVLIKGGEQFVAQVKENKRSRRKYFISVYAL